MSRLHDPVLHSVWVSASLLQLFKLRHIREIQFFISNIGSLPVPFHTSSLNTFRLWTVQLFAIIKEYETEFSLDGAAVDSNLCDMIEYKVGKSSRLIHNNTENVDVLCEAVSGRRVKLFICVSIEK